MPRCKYCAGLSIKLLVNLAKEEYVRPWDFPTRGFYQHHQSFQDLEQAAERHGCDFCRLILDCFKGCPYDPRYPNYWPKEWLGSKCDINNSIYTAAKKLPNSNIKICINRSYGHNVPLKKAPVLDTLHVLVGQVDERINFRLFLSGPRDKNSQIDEFRIGQLELDPNLRSKANFDIARKWLWACKHQHTDCLSGRASNLPTRVIDVGVDVQFRDVHILCSPPGLEGQYATLSHCWGGTISPLLTENTLASFQESLPYTTLPANFQDAITITRELGIRYLWIDSLCIKQDSKEDWEKESKNMAAVYRDSTLTISALASRGSTHGILTTESPKSSPTPATLKLLPDSPESGELVVQWRDNDDEYDANQYDIVYACPLVGRAWALQEYVLSPRQLFYGKDAIYWKCPQGFEGANGLPSGFEFPGGRSKEISSILLSEVVRQGSIPQANKKDAILEEYYDMVQTYSSKALSVESDKLPAFSGIAQRLHPALEGHYLAGIWSCDIHRGLLWRGVLSTAKRVRLYRAPSWSWAVTDSPVYFPIFSGKNSPLDAQLLNFTIVPKDKTNPYGEILSGSLTLKGLTIPLVRSTQSPEESEDKDFSYISFDEIGIDIQARIPRFKGIYGIYKRYFHRALSVVEGGSSENISALLAEKGSFWKNGSPTYRERCLALLIHLGDYEGHCLVLQKVHGRGPNTYERVGYMRLTRRRYAWYRRWTSKTLTLV